MSRSFPNPIAVLVYVSALFLSIIHIRHPFYLSALILSLAFHLFKLRALTAWKPYLRLSATIAVVFILINVLVGRAGATTLWNGFFELSVEEIGYNVSVAAQIVLLFTCFCLYHVMQDSDQAVAFFSRFMPRSVRTVVLASLLLPQLAARLSEAKDMLSARGIQFRDRHLLLRLRARLPLLKIGLLTALEGSWQTAEALEARAFGSGKRSVYATHDWRFPDFALLVSGALLWLWLFFSWVTGEGRFLFYPTLEPVLSTFHPVPFFVFLSGLALVPVCGAKYPR